MAKPWSCSSSFAALLFLILPCILQNADGGDGGPLPDAQGLALLRWKSTLASSPPALRSWSNRTRPCTWAGIVRLISTNLTQWSIRPLIHAVIEGVQLF